MPELSIFHIRVDVPTDSCISKDGGKGEAAWGPGGAQSCKRKPHPAVRAFGDVRAQRDETDMKREMEGR